jgi:hypothetical protein
MSTAIGPSGCGWVRVHVAVLLAVLALVAFIPATASAAPTPTGTACSAQVLTTIATPASHQLGHEHSVLVTHAIRHHVRSTVAQRRGSRADTGSFNRLPEGLWPPGCLTLVARCGRSTDRLLDRAVTTHPLRL